MGLTWPAVLGQLLSRQDLGADATAWAMGEIMSGNALDVQIAAFLVALRAKGETIDELAGLVDSMLDHAVPLPGLQDSVDIVGTGGDQAKTVNISSTAAIVTAATGIRVVKHGNRASSSASGAADVLEALGLRLTLSPEKVAILAQRAGITFCFANVFHPSMRFAAPARGGMAIPTAFNLLGPLTNPAHARAAAVGVADGSKAPLIAGVLARRGRSALVFRSRDGLDELSTTAVNDVWEVRGGDVTRHEFDAQDIGLARATKDDLRGGSPTHNAAVTRRVLAGEVSAVRDVVALNAAAAATAYAADASAPLAERLAAGLDAALQAIDSGRATETLERLAGTSAELAD